MAEPAPKETVATEDNLVLDRGVVDAIIDAVEAKDRSACLNALEGQHPADVADLLEQIGGTRREALVRLWGEDFDVDILPELQENLRDDLLQHLPAPVIEAAVKELENDDVVYLVEDLEPEAQGRILEALEEPDRAAVLASLQFPEDSAGRMMQREFVMAPTHWTVGDAIDAMRANTELPEQFYDLVIVDPRLRPVGVVALGRVMSAKREVRLAGLMQEEFRTIRVSQSREDVGYAFAQYHLVSAPVVDENDRLVGIITIDDAVEAMEEAGREDMLRLAGVDEDETLTDTVWATARQRFPWLLVNLATAVLASVVISFFSTTIEALVALAVLMPIVASMGGNGGTQSLTVAVRALATRDLTSANALRIIWREGVVGLINGVGFAIIIGFVGMIWYGSPMLGVVLGIAMIGTMIVAGLAGILIPLGLEKANVDPALASGAFVTTVTDVVGFLLFLGLAAAFLL